MTSTAEIRNGICLVTLDGEFDRASVEGIRAEVERCLQQAASVVFEFGDVTFVDGGMLALLREIHDSLGTGGWLGVARPRPWIRRLLEVTGLIGQPGFRILSDIKDAWAVNDRGTDGPSSHAAGDVDPDDGAAHGEGLVP